MPLPDDIRSWLVSNQHAGYAAALAKRAPDVKAHLAELGVPEASELGQFWLQFGPFCARGWYSLNEVDEVLAPTHLAREYGAPSRFIALTTFEGDGVTLYDRESEAVFDVKRGEFEALERGELAPLARSFGEFLRWCKEQR
jgi:hypothetical protein